MEGIGTAKVADNVYKYNGKELNEDLGLNLSDYGARWYDAALGRWWSVDPMGSVYVQWSYYNYGTNNPIRFTDPDGMYVSNESEQYGKELETQHSQEKLKKGLANTYNGEVLNQVAKGNAGLVKDLYENKTTHGRNSVEAGAAIIQKDDGSYRNEIFQSEGEGAVQPHLPTLGKGETHVADYHTHPGSPDYQGNSKDGPYFSPEDLTNIKNKSLDFASIVEVKMSRFSAIVTDPKAYSAFSSDKNFLKHQQGLTEAVNSDLKKYGTGYYKTHGNSIEGFDSVKVALRDQQRYLDSQNSGIQLYQTNDSLKQNFVKI